MLNYFFRVLSIEYPSTIIYSKFLNLCFIILLIVDVIFLSSFLTTVIIEKKDFFLLLIINFFLFSFNQFIIFYISLVINIKQFIYEL